MEKWDSSSLQSFFHQENFLNSYNPLDNSLEPSTPNGGRHSALIPDVLLEFLNHYFKEVVSNKPIVLTEKDNQESAYSSFFKDFFYLLWKYSQRFQEIYWEKSYEFNIAAEIFFGDNSSDLATRVEGKEASFRGYFLFNLGEEAIFLGPGFEVLPLHFGLILNTPLVKIMDFKDIDHLCVSIF